MANELSTFGVELRRGDGATPTEAFTAIQNPTDISGVGVLRELLEVTNLTDTRRRYRGGRTDGNEATVTFAYVDTDTQQAGLKTDMNNGVERSIQVHIPDGPATISFTVLVTSWDVATPDNGVATLSVGMKIVSDITVA